MASAPLAGIAVEQERSRPHRSGCLLGHGIGRVHHLVDPRTGEPADGGLRAVTGHGPDPAWAEVWSKTLFIEGRERIASSHDHADRGVVGRRRRHARDDPCRAGADRLGRRRGLATIRRAPEPVELGRGRHPLAGTGLRDGQAADGHGTSGGGLEARPAASPAASAPLSASPAPTVSTTSTACAGIGGRAAASNEQRSFGAEAHEDGPIAGLLPSNPLASFPGLPAAPASDGKLAAVRGEDVGQVEGRAGQPAGRGGVEDRRRPGDASEAERLVGRARPDLVADKDDVLTGQGEPLERVADLDRNRAPCSRRRPPRSGSRRRVDQDQGDARRLVIELDEPGQVDALGGEGGTRAPAESSAPTAPTKTPRPPAGLPRRPGCRPCRRDAARTGRRSRSRRAPASCRPG